MKTKNKSQNGITIVALIITIALLVIIAGVSIGLITEDEKIMGQADNTASRWNNSINQQSKKTNEIWDKYLPTLPAGWNNSKIEEIVTGVINVDGETIEVQVPIPKGYIASDLSNEDEVSEGLVIYQGTEKVSEDSDAATTRNQFVWIPVTDINSMVMCKDNEEGSVCNLVRQNNGDLKCMTHHANDNNTELCGRLYHLNSIYNYSYVGNYVYTYSMDYSTNAQTFDYDFREPDIVTGPIPPATGTGNDALNSLLEVARNVIRKPNS